jgi:class 3 adenylate cyclase/tetratricopeptide (TPR) repeat protein/energy-coupling factor transporter ATP-binding protein EcfA2
VMDHERASAGPVCPACGAGVPAEARFCPSCGASIVAGAPERRVVTVLFADLVDSTRLVVSLDPEDARGRLDELFRRLTAEVRRRGGTVEKYIGDAILAVFGFPTTHGDDAARAVQAALAMRDAARSLGAELTDFPPQLRIGLDTGEVVGAFAGDLRLSGEAVHTAARIQQAAAPDEVLVSIRTLRAVGDSVDTGPPRQVLAHGTQRPVEVVEVRGFVPAPPRVGPPMVDRERDLPSLVRALRRATDEGRLVLLVGEAGIGKSTLARAAAERLGPEVRVLWGRCLPEWHSLPLWPVREVLAAASGVAVAEAAPKLAAAVGRLVVEVWPEPETADHAASAVCRLIGLQSEAQAEPPNEFGARELAAILAGVFSRLAAKQPTLVVLEDIHCASRDLLKVAAILISGGLRTAARLGFLGVTRPDAAALDPAWIAQTETERIDLASLPRSATSELLAFTLGEQNPARHLRERVFEASRGNPLFVKELALAIRETGRPPDRPPSLPIPDSLRTLIGERLDRLPPERKGVLCRAAVIGRWFSPTALASLVQEEREQLERALDELAGSGLIERLPDRLTGERHGYAFHHILFRDVAYSLLPKAARSELHERLAAWLAGGGEREPPESVAPHLVEAVRLARQVRRPTVADRRLAARAVAVCRRAAQRLREQEALVAAASMLDDALDIAEIARTPGEDLAELRMLRGTLRGITGDPQSALADLEAATRSERAAIRAQAFIELSNLHGILNDYDRASAMADPAVAESKAARSPALLARALRAKALRPFVTGDLLSAAALLEEALSISGAEAGSALAIDLRSTLLPVRLYLATPLPELAEQAGALAAAARANGRRNAEAGANWVLGEVRLLQGDLAAAERHFTTADRQRRDIGLTADRVWSLLGLARVAIALGDPRRARRLAEEAVKITRTPDGLAEPDAFVHLAEAYLAERDLALAAGALERARSSVQPDDVVLHAEVERVEAHLATARGDHRAAASLLRHALAALTITDYRLDWLRTAAQLLPALVSAGLHDEAAEVAAEVRRHAEAIGAHALARGLPEAAP